jgi:hypothetical protein
VPFTVTAALTYLAAVAVLFARPGKQSEPAATALPGATPAGGE